MLGENLRRRFEPRNFQPGIQRIEPLRPDLFVLADRVAELKERFSKTEIGRLHAASSFVVDHWLNPFSIA